MSNKNTYNNQYMEYLRVKEASTVVSSVLDKGMITATRISRKSPGHGFVDQHATEDAFMLAFQLQDYHGHLWVDGRKVEFPVARKEHFTVYDYNRLWQADMISAFDCVNFYVPRAAFEGLAEDLGPKTIETLNVLPGVNVEDATVKGIVEALLPAFATPNHASQLFVDHLGLALSAHLAVTYGEARPSGNASAGLAPWQQNKALAMIDANLDGSLDINELATGCGLSASYFARSFKHSMGLPPYKWMIKRRVEKAQDLLRRTPLPIAEIATACGFSDQSHFSKVFSQITGTTPSAWRKTRHA
jgi:AraC-like DNA-binding protein